MSKTKKLINVAGWAIVTFGFCILFWFLFWPVGLLLTIAWAIWWGYGFYHTLRY